MASCQLELRTQNPLSRAVWARSRQCFWLSLPALNAEEVPHMDPRPHPQLSKCKVLCSRLARSTPSPHQHEELGRSRPLAGPSP